MSKSIILFLVFFFVNTHCLDVYEDSPFLQHIVTPYIFSGVPQIANWPILPVKNANQLVSYEEYDTVWIFADNSVVAWETTSHTFVETSIADFITVNQNSLGLVYSNQNVTDITVLLVILLQSAFGLVISATDLALAVFSCKNPTTCSFLYKIKSSFLFDHVYDIHVTDSINGTLVWIATDTGYRHKSLC